MEEHKKIDAEFWNNRWLNDNTTWDLAEVSPPIKQYFHSVDVSKKASILIPGCGNAHEALFLLDQGFEDITLIDIAPKAVERLKEKFSSTSVKVICGDFFQHQGAYDIVIEQTFFCALPPSMRKDYVRQMNNILKENGQIIGVLFNTTFEKDGPPFGGNVEQYQTLFRQAFELKKLDKCYNSISARAEKEVFIQFVRKSS